MTSEQHVPILLSGGRNDCHSCVALPLNLSLVMVDIQTINYPRRGIHMTLELGELQAHYCHGSDCFHSRLGLCICMTQLHDIQPIILLQ